jgi:hypothetical protein
VMMVLVCGCRNSDGDDTGHDTDDYDQPDF